MNRPIPFHSLTLRALAAFGLGALALGGTATDATAQQQGARPGAQRQNRPRQVVKMDSARAAELYVSTKLEDHPPADFDRQLRQKAMTDSIYAARSRGVMEFRKVSYKSTVDGMTIPAYLFAPLNKRGARGHAAMVWVHGGVHGDWGTSMFPFVKEAVQRGYVIITPDYRGSTGHGAAHYNAIDYGGKELDDVQSAVEFLKTLPYVDQDRLGIMGWSHGGFITAHLVFREHHP
ncbi:MAG TPA: alpha/beta fold hydrolase, partial [Thermoanaerobaculia bacterium]|nr:alpha/beta fold hydrolase [Thermoanaerobaculia bacterium]